MITQELLNYIKQQLQEGKNKQEIKNSLLQVGWQEQDIEEAFSSLSINQTSQTPQTNISSFQPPFEQIPTKRKNKKLIVIISIIVLFLAVIGGGIFAYFNYFQSPEKITQKMIEKLLEIKSLEYYGEIKPQFTDSSLNNAIIKFSVSSDEQDSNNPKSQFSLDLKIPLPEQLLPFLREPEQNLLPPEQNLLANELSLGLEARSINKLIYFRINNLDVRFSDLNSKFLNEPKVNLSSKWVKIDLEELKKQLGEFKYEEKELTPEQIKKIKNTIKQTKFVKIVKKLPDEKIEGVKTHHYEFTIDKEEFKNLITNIWNIITEENKKNGTSTGENDNEFMNNLMDQEVKDTVMNFVDEFSKKVNSKSEIWIGKKDLLPYKIELNFELKNPEELGGLKTINFTISFKNFNKPLQIEEPKETISLEEFLNEIELPSGLIPSLAPMPVTPMPVAPIPDTDQILDTDKDGLPDSMEVSLGTNPKKADTDGDGINDLEELQKGLDPKVPEKRSPIKRPKR
jgi:hypothetical protein